MRLRKNRGRLRPALLAASFALALPYSTQAISQQVSQTNLVTDSNAFLISQGMSAATTQDPNLINPWGMSYSSTSPFWISNQGHGNTTLYNGAGVPQPQPTPLVVSITGGAPPSGPTGQAFVGGSGFNLAGGGNAVFAFANLNGGISAWNGGSNAIVQSITPGAVYTGLALGSSGGSNYLYAADHAGGIDVFDQNFTFHALAGDFTDPGLPSGLTPFNIANIGGVLYVTYAQAGPDADEAPLGSGIVDRFNMDGTFIDRFVTGSLSNNVLSPWGITQAPSAFGPFGGAILIGNFAEEDGFINAFSQSDGTYLGRLLSGSDPYSMPYLWSLGTRPTGGAGSDPNAVYFTAGIGDEEHGLFGRLNAVPEPSSWAMMLMGFGAMGLAVRRSSKPRHAQVA